MLARNLLTYLVRSTNLKLCTYNVNIVTATTTYSFVVWDFDNIIPRGDHIIITKKKKGEEEKKEEDEVSPTKQLKPTLGKR